MQRSTEPSAKNGVHHDIAVIENTGEKSTGLQTGLAHGLIRAQCITAELRRVAKLRYDDIETGIPRMTGNDVAVAGVVTQTAYDQHPA